MDAAELAALIAEHAPDHAHHPREGERQSDGHTIVVRCQCGVSLTFGDGPDGPVHLPVEVDRWLDRG